LGGGDGNESMMAATGVERRTKENGRQQQLTAVYCGGRQRMSKTRGDLTEGSGGVVVINPFFLPAFYPQPPFFLPASAFYPRLPPKQTLTNKIRVDLPAGRKKRFSLYRRTRGVLRLTGLSPFARKLYLTYDEYFYFYFIPT
jgi:hypothetical protein